MNRLTQLVTKQCVNIAQPSMQHRSFQISSALLKTTAGKFRVSKFNNKPLSYDQSFKPKYIGVTKGLLSFHTGNLHAEDGAHMRMYEDMFIRRFISGTFYRMFAGELVIKRRFNMIEIIALCDTDKTVKGTKIFFLVAYTERLLSAYLKCIVKMHVVKVSKEDVIYKYV